MNDLLPKIYPKRIHWLFISFFLFSCNDTSAQQATDFFLLHHQENPLHISIGLKNTDEKEPFFQVFLEEVWREKGQDGTPILGTSHRRTDTLLFRPLLPFSYTLDYIAVAADGKTFSFRGPTPAQFNRPKLEAIFPNVDTLPANLLKVYLLFSKPMSDVNPYRFISLEDEAGNRLEHSFLESPSRLWNAQRNQLTLWLHPGRIKRDLGPNQSLGAPLQAGRRYRLRISKKWTCQEGIQLSTKEDITYSWFVGPADRKRPSTKNWTLNLPTVNSRKSLTISFGEILDPFIGQRAFQVLDPLGQPVPGFQEMATDSRSVVFTPTENWTKGRYTIRIDGLLEDLAGNNLLRLFDRDLWQEKEEVKEETIIELAFKI